MSRNILDDPSIRNRYSFDDVAPHTILDASVQFYLRYATYTQPFRIWICEYWDDKPRTGAILGTFKEKLIPQEIINLYKSQVCMWSVYI
jgi:hypothetical protein